MSIQLLVQADKRIAPGQCYSTCIPTTFLTHSAAGLSVTVYFVYWSFRLLSGPFTYLLVKLRVVHYALKCNKIAAKNKGNLSLTYLLVVNP